MRGDNAGMGAHVVRNRRIANGLLLAALMCGLLLLVSTRLVAGVKFGRFHALLMGAGAIGWVSSDGPYEKNPAVRLGPVFFDRCDDSMEWWVIAEIDAGESVVAAPFWMPLLATLIPGTILWWRTRHIRGHCRACRYDLSGLPVGAPCPECGRAEQSSATP